ncbi:unnamed protein product, partial [Porites evermanni]
MSDHGDWGDSADDDGSELIRTLSRLVPFSDVDVSSESEESSDVDLETVSEKNYHSDGKAAPTYLAAAKKNLPEEECVEERYRDLFLRRSSFVVRRGRFVTHPGSRRLLFVTIYNAPHELPDSAIEHRLGKYGRIFSSRRGKVPGYPDVFNGLRHLRMDILSHIPCFLRFGKYQIRVKYDGQPTTCRRCNSRDLLFKDCTNEVCLNCDRIGHHARMSPEDMRCCICKEEGHLAIDCQHSWYRRPPPSLGLFPETVTGDPVESALAPTADTVAESPVESAPAP